MALREKFEEVNTTVKQWLDSVYEGVPTLPDIPEDSVEKRPEMEGFVEALVKDSKAWRTSSLQNRFKYFADPVQFWRFCRVLEAGMHWDVWGRRNTELGSEWRSEVVYNQIGDQVRARKTYIAGAWHDIAVIPNLAHINDIIAQERDRSDWGDNIRLAVHRLLTEGTVVFKSVLDESTNPDGQAREVICDNEGILPTPNATGLAKREGNWYLIHATIASLQQIREEFPRQTVGSVETLSGFAARDIAPRRENEPINDYTNTKFVERIEVWMDDNALTDIEFDPREVEEEHAKLDNAEPINPEEGQNHIEHIRAHLAYAEEMVAATELGSPDDQEHTEAFIGFLMEHVAEHRQMAEEEAARNDDQGIPPGKKRKYPDGRKVVVAGKKVMQDIPNELGFDWRALFRKVNCETLPNHFWGRGIPEILWNPNHIVDLTLSRTLDQAVTTGTPKPWFHIDDKELLAEAGFNNDPTKPGFYTINPPTFPTGSVSPQLLEIYNIMTQELTQSLGVNEAIRGESPSSDASGTLVKQLIQQSVILVTGEANANLNSALEDVIETRLKLMRELYKKPRIYVIDGKFKAINVSKSLRVQPVEVQGEMVDQEIPYFEVRVKPESNFPNQWESEFAFALQLATTVMADGLPVIPREAILDILASKYPQWSKDGPYYQMSEALQKGLAVMKQEEERALADERTMQQIEEKEKGAAMKMLFNEQGVNGNGKKTETARK